MDTKKLRQKILDLAIRGKLVPQDPNDEPASVLLDRIRAEKERLISEGKIKRSKAGKTSDASHYQNLPKGWAVTSLGEVVKFINGRAYRKDELLSSGKYKVLRVGNFFTNNSWYYSDLELEADKYCDRGDLLYAWSASFGAKIWDGEKTIFHYHIWKLEFDECLLNKKFLYYFLEYDKLKIMESTTGSTMIHVSMENMMPRNIFIPPLSEQCRIVNAINAYMSYIDKLDNATTEISAYVNSAKSKILDLAISGKLVPQNSNDESAIAALRRINPSFKPCDNPQYEQLPLGWCECQLSNLCDFLSRGKSPKYSDMPNMYPVFAQKCNLKEGGVSLEQARFLDPSTLSKWPQVYKLKTGDILINSTGTGTVGRTRLFNDNVLGEYPFVVPDSHVSVVRCYGEICSRFLYYYLTSPKIQQYFENNLAGSTNQKELYIGVIGATSVLVPPIAEQQRIVDKVNELFTILDCIQNSLEAK